jgi:lysyl-tRNA synthetase class 2
MIKSGLRLRAALLRSLRAFFDGKGFLEVETPVLINAPAPEENIETVRAGGGFLRASPELEMKRLAAAGYGDIYQTGPCFRKGERGRLHREEFTMLEWYQADASYLEVASLTREMICRAADAVLGSQKICFRGKEIDLSGEWLRVTVPEAFERHAGVSAARAVGEDKFDELLVTKVEPALALEPRPVFLTDYPAPLASLSKLSDKDSSIAERWELYIGGVELANAYSELTSPSEQKKRFAEAAEKRRAAKMNEYPPPEKFFEALESGLPRCAGCALGLDRLAMVFSGADSLDAVTFPAES